jgi:hypothetical protein
MTMENDAGKLRIRFHQDALCSSNRQVSTPAGGAAGFPAAAVIRLHTPLSFEGQDAAARASAPGVSNTIRGRTMTTTNFMPELSAGLRRTARALAVAGFGLLALGSATAWNAPAALAGQQDFTLINNTGYELKELYVAPSKSEDWQEDVLGRDTLGDGEQTNITFARDEGTCNWDLKVVYTDDNSSVEWHSVNLCDISTVTIKYNASTGETTAFAK